MDTDDVRSQYPVRLLPSLEVAQICNCFCSVNVFTDGSCTELAIDLRAEIVAIRMVTGIKCIFWVTWMKIKLETGIIRICEPPGERTLSFLGVL